MWLTDVSPREIQGQPPFRLATALSVCIPAHAARVAEAKSDGIILTVMGLYPDGWSQVNRFLENRGDIPVIVYAPQGTQFTPVLQAYREIPSVFVGATQDVEWLATAAFMLNTIRRMADTRIAVVQGDQESEQVLAPLGTMLHHIPLERFAEIYDATENADVAKAIAEAYRQAAKGIVEPSDVDILEAARTALPRRRWTDLTRPTPNTFCALITNQTSAWRHKYCCARARMLP